MTYLGKKEILMVAGRRHGLEIVSKARTLYKEGVSKRGISRSLGICYSSVRRFTDPRYEATVSRVRVHIDGVSHRTKVEKRPRPSNCEICGSLAIFHERSLYWHHWDNNHLEWGLWLCNWCHMGAEFIEKERDKRYRELKETVECST